jgi:hypothetical protein
MRYPALAIPDSLLSFPGIVYRNFRTIHKLHAQLRIYWLWRLWLLLNWLRRSRRCGLLRVFVPVLSRSITNPSTEQKDSAKRDDPDTSGGNHFYCTLGYGLEPAD